MIAFSDDVEILIEELEQKDELSPKEKIILDVIDTINIVEEDGLHGFWYSSLNTETSIKALDEIGAAELVDLIQSSQWCTSSASDRGELSETELTHLSELEEDLIPMLEDVPELLEEFLEEE